MNKDDITAKQIEILRVAIADTIKSCQTKQGFVRKPIPTAREILKQLKAVEKDN